MNELICTVLIILAIMILAPIAYVIVVFGPKILDFVIATIKWNLGKFKRNDWDDWN